MINAKFTKCGDARFLSHIDMLKGIVYTLRRAEIKVKYSQGHNPHPLIKFSPPLPLGLASRAEYFTVQLVEKAKTEEFASAFNQVSRDGINVLVTVESESDPNFAARIVQSDYILQSPLPLPKAVEQLAKEDCIIEYTQKGIKVQEEVSGKIKALEVSGKELFARLATGAENLRLDRLLTKINEQFKLKLSITHALRTAQYVQGEQALIDACRYLKELK